MKDCSKTEIYLKEKERMCELLDTCEKCFFQEYNRLAFTPCEYFESLEPLKAIEIVQKWSDEHPDIPDIKVGKKVRVKHVRVKKGK